MMERRMKTPSWQSTLLNRVFAARNCTTNILLLPVFVILLWQQIYHGARNHASTFQPPTIERRPATRHAPTNIPFSNLPNNSKATQKEAYRGWETAELIFFPTTTTGHGTLPKLTLEEPTAAPHNTLSTCPNLDQIMVSNIPATFHQQKTTKLSAVHNAIPKRIHQTSKSRCLTQAFYNATENWRVFGRRELSNEWAYYFHDDNAVRRLFQQESATIPNLSAIAEQCLAHGTLKADLWRYLVLYTYGGVYSDLDSIPRLLTPSHIEETNDALFVLDQYHVLSQYFMAVAPHHPILWYAIQHSLWNLWSAPDTGSALASKTTGPAALHQAFMSFRNDVGAHVDPAIAGYKPVQAGNYMGTHNRSITVIGVAENQNEFVQRDVIGQQKRANYFHMGMRHFSDDKNYPSGRSCKSSILESSK
jgi:mannosyltransferase OCH1-like enzyme